MLLKTLEKCTQKFMRYIAKSLFQPQNQHGEQLQKRTKVKLEVLRDINMFLMVQKIIRERIYLSSNRHAKADNKYMKDYDETEE